jgi:hypothetical protein
MHIADAIAAEAQKSGWPLESNGYKKPFEYCGYDHKNFKANSTLVIFIQFLLH